MFRDRTLTGPDQLVMAPLPQPLPSSHIYIIFLASLYVWDPGTSICWLLDQDLKV